MNERSYSNLQKIIVKLLDIRLYLIDEICAFIMWRANKYNEYLIRKYADIDKTVILGEFCKIDRNVKINANTYINSYSQIFASSNSSVTIGKNCSIGYNVHIKARTHNKENPNKIYNDIPPRIEKSILIGDNVWIGDNVFIREGITIGENCIIGANSVVTHSFDDNLIIAGIPAKIIGNVSQNDKK